MYIGVCFLQRVKFTEVWHIMWFFAETLISHSHKDTAHSGASRVTHPYKYIFSLPVVCSQQLSLLYWMNDSLISKIYFLQCLFFSKIFTCQSHLLIRCYKARIFLWSTNNTDRNGVNKQNTHTPNTQRKGTLARVSMK